VLSECPLHGGVPQQRRDFRQYLGCAVPTLLPLDAFLVMKSALLDAFLALALQPGRRHPTADRRDRSTNERQKRCQVGRHKLPPTSVIGEAYLLHRTGLIDRPGRW
jgi:hypothetical protein